MRTPYSIIVHGGAWAIPEAATEASLEGVRTAARIGHQVLAQGGSALDAVEAAVRELEDNSSFAAGLGSCLTENGTVELDAAVMEAPVGGRARAGAIAAASGVRNPVSVARAVAERSEHVLLVAHGANSFAQEVGAELVEPRSLVTPGALAEWDRFNKYGKVVNELFNSHDTVGAAAVDKYGCVAAATSTGGITFKRSGRVGDSPIIGAGLFADAGVGACSTTGHGESILQTALARHALWLLERDGMSPIQAAEEALSYMKRKSGGCGGLIIVNGKGELGHAFSTTRMVWSSMDTNGKCCSGIDPAR